MKFKGLKIFIHNFKLQILKLQISFFDILWILWLDDHLWNLDRGRIQATVVTNDNKRKIHLSSSNFSHIWKSKRTGTAQSEKVRSPSPNENSKGLPFLTRQTEMKCENSSFLGFLMKIPERKRKSLTLKKCKQKSSKSCQGASNSVSQHFL